MNNNNLFFLLLLCTTITTFPMERIVIEHSQIKHLLTKYSRSKQIYKPLTSDTPDYCQYKKNLNEKGLRKAAKNNEEADISQLISLNIWNADISAPDPETYDTALHWAAHHGNVSIGKLLLNKGATVDAKNKNGCTPLYNATQSLLYNRDSQNYVEFIDLLLQHNAQITIKNNSGYRPDNDLTADNETTTPPNEIDNRIYIRLSAQCIAPNKKYRFKIVADTSPVNLSIEEIKKQERIAANRAHTLLLCSRLEKEINKQKRLNINRAHALFVYERLQHPELSRRQGTDTPLYYQETKIYGYSLWCPYSNKLMWVSK